MNPQMHTLTVITADGQHVYSVPHGANLRETLLTHGHSPYAALTRRLNCGGRGLCATCGVWIEAGEPSPVHWHDKLAAAYAYPRLSCQIEIVQAMTVLLIADKRIWGDRDPSRQFQASSGSPSTSKRNTS